MVKSPLMVLLRQLMQAQREEHLALWMVPWLSWMMPLPWILVLLVPEMRALCVEPKSA
jgi:hypothetical protein